MEYENIKKLMSDMSNSKLTEIDIHFQDGTEIRMKKEAQKEECTNKKTNIIESEEKQEINEKTVIQGEKEKEIYIESPMVGTFYLKPSPTEKPYIEIGQEVKKGDTLCIIEAMKLMNEIESEYSGKITQILVKDGDTVEYGTKLFKIE